MGFLNCNPLDWNGDSKQLMDFIISHLGMNLIIAYLRLFPLFEAVRSSCLGKGEMLLFNLDALGI